MSSISSYIYKNDNMACFLLKKMALCFVKLDAKISPVRYGLNKTERKEKVIVSMASYPARFETIIAPLKTLLRQTVKPDRIIVWLGNDASENELTDEMHALEKYGVEYRFDHEKDLKPHKKYFYAMQEFPNDIIITVDDDILFPRTMISSLLKVHKKHPDYVCARRIHRIVVQNDGSIAPYSQWRWEVRDISEKPNVLNFGTNGAGTLFPPNSLDKRAFDADAICKKCEKADDVWIWFMERLAHTDVIWVPCILIHPPVVEITRNRESLANTNIVENGNDAYVKTLMHQYADEIVIGEIEQ